MILKVHYRLYFQLWHIIHMTILCSHYPPKQLLLCLVLSSSLDAQIRSFSHQTREIWRNVYNPFLPLPGNTGWMKLGSWPFVIYVTQSGTWFLQLKIKCGLNKIEELISISLRAEGENIDLTYSCRDLQTAQKECWEHWALKGGHQLNPQNETSGKMEHICSLGLEMCI